MVYAYTPSKLPIHGRIPGPGTLREFKSKVRSATRDRA